MDDDILSQESRELLVFAGYSLGYGIHLYGGQHVQPDTLCQLLLQQNGIKRYIGFESDSVQESYKAAQQYLWEFAVLEGYEMAALIFDCHSRLPLRKGLENRLAVLLYASHLPGEWRTVSCPYDRVRGAFIPSNAFSLDMSWPKSERDISNPWISQGMKIFHQDHYTIM
jgi:hypothetical protein